MSETEHTTETTQDKPATIELIDTLKKSKAIYDSFAKQFKTRYMFEGKKLTEWQTHFHVRIPGDLNPRMCIQINSKLNDLFEEAMGYKRLAEQSLASIKTTCNSKFRDAFNNLVNEYKSTGQRLPAKDTLTQLAEYKNSTLIDAVVHAEMHLSFWKEIVAGLTNARKLIENNTINLSVEAKALAHERYIDNMNQNGNNGNNSNNNGGYYG